MRRPQWVVAVLLVLTSSIATIGVLKFALAADVGQRTGSVDKQVLAWTEVSESTSSSDFRPLGGLRTLHVANRGPISITFSGDFSGAAVDLRIVGIGGTPIRPGIAHFDPSAGTTSFSFTFGAAGGKGSCRDFTLQWASPTGGPVTIQHGLLVATYKRADDVQGCG